MFADARRKAADRAVLAVAWRAAGTGGPMAHAPEIAAHGFSLTQGGPFYALMRRVHLSRADGTLTAWPLVLIGWLPIVLGEAGRLVLRVPLDPMAYDLSLHVRLLVGLPLLIDAERLIEPQCKGAIAEVETGKIAERAALEPILHRAERLRDSRWAELVLVALAVTGGQLALWQVIGTTGVVHGGISASSWSFPRLWYGVIGLPLVQFVLYRWLWRWLIWSYVLVRLSRLSLAALATHPDHAAGLAPLAWPVSGFAGLALAVGAVLAGAWGTQLLADRVTLHGLMPAMAAYLVLVVCVACGPLIVFIPHLYRARRLALYAYGGLALEYVRAFQVHWIEKRAADARLLGSPDIQSLNDLLTAFQVIVRTRLFACSSRQVVILLLAAFLPMLPLWASAVTVEQVLRRLIGAVVGGIPS
jgi:hypothetical protein